MPRPKKWRRVCCMPQSTSFAPQQCRVKSTVDMTVDEYETIRLIDYEGLRQEECAEQMEVSRTTAQAIYNSARKKLSKCLVEGVPLRIIGGDIKLCEHAQGMCTHKCCRGKYIDDINMKEGNKNE